MITNTRAASLQDMVDILSEQRARRHDVVVSPDKIRFTEGQLELRGFEPMLSEDGFTQVDGFYQPTEVFDGDMAQWLDIPPDLVRKLRSGRPGGFGPPRPDLYDALMNGMVHGRKPKTRMVRNYESDLLEEEIVREGVSGKTNLSLLRLFVSDDGLQNIARTRKSSRFCVMDNLDALMAMLTGIEKAGLDPSTLKITGDLSETRMYIKVHAPEVFVLAPELLAGYRSPFEDPGVDAQRVAQRIADGQAYNEGTLPRDFHIERGNEPIVHAGFVLSNSEVGQGKYHIAHQLVVLTCTNGMTRTKDALEKTHIGASLPEGAVKWSTETMKANVDLIQTMAADAVTTFLSPEYLQMAVDEMTAKATKRIVSPDLRAVIEPILKDRQIAFDDTAIAGIMDHFLLGGQRTTGGLAQAITSYSQTVDSADEAFNLDAKALPAMELAYAKL